MTRIMTQTFTKAALLAMSLAITGPLHAETAALASHLRATELVEQALAAHGGLSAMQDAGGFEVRLEGTYDLTTRLQGRSPFSDEPTPIFERIVFDADTGRVSYDVDMFNYYSSNQRLPEIYDDQRRMVYIDKRKRDAGWVPIQTVPDCR